MFKNLRMTLVLAKTPNDIIGLKSGKLPWFTEDYSSLVFDKHIEDRKVAIVSDFKTSDNNAIVKSEINNAYVYIFDHEEDYRDGSTLTTIQTLSNVLEKDSIENKFNEVYIVGSLDLYEKLYDYTNELFIINTTADPVVAGFTPEECVDGKDLIKRIKSDFMTFRYTNDNTCSTDTHVTSGIRRETPIKCRLGEKTKKSIRKALYDFYDARETNSTLDDIYENLLLNISNRVITVCVDCVPINPRFIVPMLKIDEVITINPIHGFKVMDLSVFCFDTLLRGFDVCLSTDKKGNILLSELLEM